MCLCVYRIFTYVGFRAPAPAAAAPARPPVRAFS